MLTPETLLEKALAATTAQSPADDRLAEVARIFIKALHSAVQETKLTHAEWLAGIDFLISIGQFSDDKRNELILLSDVLGVSAQVDLGADMIEERETSCTGLGPFYIAGQDILPDGASIIRIDVPGDPVWFTGRLVTSSGKPMSGVKVDVWQAHQDGHYDLQDGDVPNMRGLFETGEDGRFNFVGVMTGGYPLPSDGPVRPIFNRIRKADMRPAHYHFMIQRPGQSPYVTHLFMEGDPYLETDPVFGVRDDLIISFDKITERSGKEPAALPGGDYYRATFDFVL